MHTSKLFSYTFKVQIRFSSEKKCDSDVKVAPVQRNRSLPSRKSYSPIQRLNAMLPKTYQAEELQEPFDLKTQEKQGNMQNDKNTTEKIRPKRIYSAYDRLMEQIPIKEKPDSDTT